MAGSESGEAASAVIRSVFEEDVMLGLGMELRHGCRVHGLRGMWPMGQQTAWAAREKHSQTRSWLTQDSRVQKANQEHV